MYSAQIMEEILSFLTFVYSPFSSCFTSGYTLATVEKMILYTGHLSHLGSIVTAAIVVVFMKLLCIEIVFSFYFLLCLFIMCMFWIALPS